MFFFVVTFFLYEQKNNIYKIILSILLSSFFMVAYGIIQATGFDIILWQSNFAGRAASTLGNPNFLAGHIALVLPLIYSIVFIQYERKKAIWFFLIALVLTYGLLITQTRGAYLAFLLSMIFMVILILIYKKDIFIENKKIFIFGLTLIIFLLAAYFLFNKNATERIKKILLAQDEAAQIRLSLWKNSINVFKDNLLLGTGAGNFPIKYSYYQASSLTPDYFKKSDFYRSSHSHNDYIQFAAEYGFLGACIIFCLIFVLFKTSFSYLNSEKNYKIFVIGIISGILGLLIHAVFNFPFLIIPTAAYFYCFTAMLMYACEKSSVELITCNSKIKYPVILFVLLFILIMIFSFNSFLSNIYLRKAKENEYFNKMNDAIYYAEMAVKIDSNYEENYMTLAVLYEKTGNIKKSCECYKKIYSLNSGYWEANLNLFDCYATEDLKDKMLEIGENLYRLSPYSKKAIRSLGLGFYINGQYKNAIEIFSKGLGLYNDDYEFLTFLGVSYAANGEFENAIANFKKAININPYFKDAYFNMAVTYYSFKKYKEAKDLIENMKKSGFYDEKTENLLKAIQNEK